MTAVVLFTRDLRVHDNPALHAATVDGERVVPLFVLDDGHPAGGFNRPNRAHFLAACAGRPRRALCGSAAAGSWSAAATWSRSARAVAAAVGAGRRARRRATSAGTPSAARSGWPSGWPRDGRELEVHDDTLFVVPPGRVTASRPDHMAVFTPYFRRWQQRAAARRRSARRARSGCRACRAGAAGAAGADICAGETVAGAARTAARPPGRARMAAFLRGRRRAATPTGHDDLAGDLTSRLSPYLHFGCLSPLELVTGPRRSRDFVRQVAWRDFHHQVLAARPDAVRQRLPDPRGPLARRSARTSRPGRQGRTGYPLVDAGMRQLLREGWMHNRARLVVGHFLTKTLYVDWRLGAQHFVDRWSTATPRTTR